MTPLELVVAALAVIRITRLVVIDTLWEGTRDRLIDWAAAGSWRRQKLGELIGCPHCVGVWAAIAVVAAHETIPDWWWHLGVTVLALAAVTSILAEVGERIEGD